MPGCNANTCEACNEDATCPHCGNDDVNTLFVHVHDEINTVDKFGN